MLFFPSSRTTLRAAVLAGCVAVSMPALGWQHGVRPGRGNQLRSHGGVLGNDRHEHLAQWYARHQDLPLKEQQEALEKEPGFRQLPQPAQRRMLNHLSQLNNMSPEQRQRYIQRTEILEHQTPAERQRFRNSVKELGALPVDRRRLVARAFRDIREMPIPQRQSVLNSDRFRGEFTDHERTILSTLLSVEPYVSAPRRNESSEADRVAPPPQ